MTTIATQRNKVITDQPEPDDVMVEVILFGEGDTPGTVCGRKLLQQPITHYQECLDWALGIADQMARPIYVVPLNHSDIFNTAGWKESDINRWVANPAGWRPRSRNEFDFLNDY